MTEPIAWPVQRILRCPSVIPPLPISFEFVFEGRRSHRAIVAAPLREIVNAVAYATRPRYILDEDKFGRTKRPSPSAGALHPVEIGIIDWRGAPRVMRYQPNSNELALMRPPETSRLQDFIHNIRHVVSGSHVSAIVLMADEARLAASYDYSTSLLWRDAGALLQTIFLSATAFRLAYCPVGLLGQEVIEALGLQDRMVGAGVALIGRKS